MFLRSKVVSARQFVNGICVLWLIFYHLWTFVCLREMEKGYSDYRFDHVAFLGFRYYHSIEYTNLDWLKALSYRNF